MPKARPQGSVSEQALRQWLRTHEDSPGAEVARARLEYQDLEGTARSVRVLAAGPPRVRPRVLITSQVSGRWSTTQPALVGLPKPVRDVLVPDVGTWWLHTDKKSVEGLLAAVYSNERADLDPFERGEDLHIATLRRMFPQEVIADSDPRRQLAKTTRYNLAYAYDERGILDAPDLGVFGGRAAALAFATQYLASRPALVAAKGKVFAESWRTHEARSGYGRLRRLTGDQRTQAKDGWSHTIQGTVSGMMHRLILAYLALDPEARLVLNAHDGLILAWPERGDAYRESIVAQCRAINDAPVVLWGREYVYPADWGVQLPEEEKV